MRRPRPYEFHPLPYFSWDSRPLSLPVSEEEAATATYLANGDLNAAAQLLKVTIARLNKCVRKYPRLQQLITVLAETSG